MVMRSKWLAAAVIAGGLAVGPLAVPALAQGHPIETIVCEGLGTIDVSVQPADSFGAVQIVGTNGHLIPVAFTFTLENLTDNTLLFSESEAKNGHRNQETIQCSQSFTGTFEELAGPDEEPPPGVDPDDILRFTLTADVVAKI